MLIKFILASLVLSLMPGPDIIFVMTQSITRGAKAAFGVTLGLCSGLLVHTAAVSLGVSAIIAASPIMLTIIKFFGGAYLVWLGIGAVLPRSGDNAQRQDIKSESSDIEYTFAKLYRQGVIMNLLNPKVILFFLSFLPLFVPKETSVPAGLYIAFLGLCFICAGFSVFTAVSLFGGYLNNVLHIDKYANSRVFAYISAGIYCLIAGLVVLG